MVDTCCFYGLIQQLQSDLVSSSEFILVRFVVRRSADWKMISRRKSVKESPPPLRALRAEKENKCVVEALTARRSRTAMRVKLFEKEPSGSPGGAEGGDGSLQNNAVRWVGGLGVGVMCVCCSDGRSRLRAAIDIP